MFLCSQPFFQWRGSPIRVKYNLMAFSQLGYEVDLVTLPIGDDVDLPGLRIHRVAPLPGIHDVPIGPSLAKLRLGLRIFRAARNLLRQRPYAAIHAVEEMAALATLLPRQPRIPLVYEKHSDPASHRKNRKTALLMALYSQIERYSAWRANAVVVTGAGLERQVRSWFPDKPCSHISDIPSSLREADPDRTRELRRSLRQRPDEILACYVGSFAAYQGIDLLFAAIPLALAQAPRLRFLVVGGSDAEISARRAALERQHGAAQVTFLGKIDPDALPAYLAASDILLSPRISGNNTPLKLLDYLKAGAPILATDLPANRLILDESTAAFAPPDPPAFAQALADLSRDPDRRHALAARGAQLLRSTYNFDRYARQLAHLYQSLLPPRHFPVAP